MTSRITFSSSQSALGFSTKNIGGQKDSMQSDARDSTLVPSMHIYVSDNGLRYILCHLPSYPVEKTEKTIVITCSQNTSSMIFAFILHEVIDPIAGLS